MKKVFLTALFAVGALFNGTAQTNDAFPVPGTNFQQFNGDGYTNFYTTDVTKVYENGYTYGNNVGFVFTVNDDGALYTAMVGVVAGNESAPTKYTVETQLMFNGDKSTIVSTINPNLNAKTGRLTLGNSQGAIFNIADSHTLHVRVYDPYDKSYVVYRIELQGGDIIVNAIDALQQAAKNGGGDPFGNTTNGDPFGKTKNVAALDVDKYVLEYQPTLINPFNLREFLGVFVSDAQVNYGLDFSYIYDYEIDLEFSTTGFDRLESETIAYTDAFGDDKRVHIVVNAARWNDASPIKRLMIFYHELGHDILNLDHIADEGPLMSVYAPKDVSIENFIELRDEMFNDYTLQN